MSIDQTLSDLTAALTRNSDLLERVVAGQQAALEKLDAGAAKPRSTRKPKDAAEEPGAGNAANAGTGSGQDDAKTAGDGAVSVAAIADGITDEASIKQYADGWLVEDQATRAKQVDLLKAAAQHFGETPKFADLLPHKHQFVFFVERDRAGLPVDFNADYDFDGDPAQDAAPAGGGSDFG